MAGAWALSHAGLAAVRQDAAPQPVAVPLPTRPPDGAIVLMDEKEDTLKANWFRRGSKEPAAWEVSPDGAATTPEHPKQHDITSREEFGDSYVHLEFRCPADGDGKPIGSGNSGVGLQGRYEVQILNSYGQQPEAHQCGALYSQKAPRVIASRKAGEWQTYDIVFRAPRFDADGKVTEQARATVFQNGIVVQNNEAFNGPTGIQYGDFPGEVKAGPMVLQGDHERVSYRNIWVVPLS